MAMLIKLIFFYLAAVIVGSALMVIFQRNPVRSALFLLVTLVHIAVLYLLLNAEFLAAIQVIVYAGAILILYIFVVMLLRTEKEHRFLNRQYPLGLFIGLLLLGQFFFILSRSVFAGFQGTYTIEKVRAVGNSKVVGQVLYTDFILPFEITSIILLVAMIGAIVLAKKKIKR